MSTSYGPGDLCNSIFRAIPASLFIEKSYGEIDYQNRDEIEKLGIDLQQGNMIYENTINLTESNFFDFMRNGNNFHFNIMIDGYFQTRKIALMMCDYFRENFPHLYDANPFKERYLNNNDIFIHIRLGDAKNHNRGIHYYEKAINMITDYENGYIATDSPEDDIVKYISKKYNFKVLNRIECIQFGFVTNNIILSHGTFSAIIGYMAISSNVYYPSGEPGWCPKGIYEIPWWHSVEWI
jgi:hypothetical protein